MIMLPINKEDVFLMIEKQQLDSLIEFCKTMPPEFKRLVEFNMEINIPFFDLASVFEVKIFEYKEETNEMHILSTYNLKEIIQILIP